MRARSRRLPRTGEGRCRLIWPRISPCLFLSVRMLTYALPASIASSWERTAPSKRAAAHRHDAALRADGAFIGVAGHPVQVRNHDASGVRTLEG
jgi:hypothetical protein